MFYILNNQALFSTGENADTCSKQQKNQALNMHFEPSFPLCPLNMSHSWQEQPDLHVHTNGILFWLAMLQYMIYILTKSQWQTDFGSGALEWIHCRLWHWWFLIASVHNGSIGRVLNKNLFLSSELLSPIARDFFFSWSLNVADNKTGTGDKCKSNYLKNLSVVFTKEVKVWNLLLFFETTQNQCNAYSPIIFYFKLVTELK